MDLNKFRPAKVENLMLSSLYGGVSSDRRTSYETENGDCQVDHLAACGRTTYADGSTNSNDTVNEH